MQHYCTICRGLRDGKGNKTSWFLTSDRAVRSIGRLRTGEQDFTCRSAAVICQHGSDLGSMQIRQRLQLHQELGQSSF